MIQQRAAHLLEQSDLLIVLNDGGTIVEAHSICMYMYNKDGTKDPLKIKVLTDFNSLRIDNVKE